MVRSWRLVLELVAVSALLFVSFYYAAGASLDDPDVYMMQDTGS